MYYLYIISILTSIIYTHLYRSVEWALACSLSVLKLESSCSLLGILTVTVYIYIKIAAV